MSYQEDVLRRWVEDLLVETGHTPSSLAREAGLAGSTLTRFLQKENASQTLSRRSIQRLAEHFGRALPGTAEDYDETSGADFVSFMRSSPLMGVELEMDERRTENDRKAL